MILSLTLILLCQLIGEVLARGTGWPVPGPVIGMAILLIILMLRDRRMDLAPVELRDGTMERTGHGLLAHLSLLFVPAGVGVVERLDVVSQHGLGLAIALIASTVLTLLVTVSVFGAASRRLGRGDEQEDA